jgi:putative pyruvate formate lyase activating enzyme
MRELPASFPSADRNGGLRLPLQAEERFILPRREFQAAYLNLHAAGRLRERVETGLTWLAACRTCPRDCQVNRLANRSGACQAGRQARVSSAFPHLGEEDCLRGWNGSGTIFFAHCSLRCVFCQNYELSHLGEGNEVTASELAGQMLRLQAAGCHNINLVTPSHVVPQILEALPLATEGGLQLPLIYNTGGYDSVETLRLLDGVVDIYMPDFKLWDPQHCRKYLTTADYAEAARAALREMHRQVGDLIVDEDGLALRGLLVRHLVMPGLLDDTQAILQFLAEQLSPDTFVNVMSQYRPAGRALLDLRFSAIRRPLASTEYRQALRLARAAGLWRLDQRAAV